MSKKNYDEKKIVIKHWNKVDLSEDKLSLHAYLIDTAGKVKYHAIINNELAVSIKVPLDNMLTTATLLAALVELEVLVEKHIHPGIFELHRAAAEAKAKVDYEAKQAKVAEVTTEAPKSE